ncbi:MAG: lamin tail domain-containing protein, partial [Myxococcota bacterium]
MMMGAWAAAAFGGAVVIDEVVPDAEGTDEGYEWIELVNTSERPVDLAGWSIEAATSTIEARHVFDPVVLRPGERLVVGEALVPEAQVVAVLALGNAGSNADLVRLVDAEGAVVDTVVYGAPNTDGWLDDRGATAAGAPTPTSGWSLARAAGAVDTDDASVDFAVVLPTPGAPTAEPPPPCEPGPAPAVRVNEVFTDPVGDDAGFEWVELYNPGPEPASLAGLSLWFETRADAREVWAFPEGAELVAGGFAVVGGDRVAEATWTGGFS